MLYRGESLYIRYNTDANVVNGLKTTRLMSSLIKFKNLSVFIKFTQFGSVISYRL